MISDELIKNEINLLWNDLIKSIEQLVSIPSVIDKTSSQYPFGENIATALKTALQLCKEIGFRTYCDPEGYYGYAEIGEGSELVVVLGHLDVVPPGDLSLWRHDPFNPIQEEGKLYGRGTQDNKGPILAAVYAAKILMNLGVTFNKRLRFVFGTDEESSWSDMERYKSKEEKATLGFTPDSSFPIIYAEKGLLEAILKGQNDTNLILEGGNSFNSVPDNIIYRGSNQEELKASLFSLGYEYEELDDCVKILGKAAHAAASEKGINSINRLAIALKNMGVTSKIIEFIVNEVKEDPYASQIFGGCEDEVSGKLKFNIGKISFTDEEKLYIDIRIPVTIDNYEITSKLSEAAGRYGLQFEEHSWLNSLYVPKDHFLIRTLMDVYQEVTGDVISQPISSGGATYARTMENCVAFGPMLPDRPETEHQPNEYIDLADLRTTVEIYVKAIYKLTRTPLI